MTSRRDVLALLAGAACPGFALAQQLPRLGILMAGRRASAQAWLRGYRDAAASVGAKATLELSFADGKPERLPGLAADLVRRGVLAIIAVDEPSFKAASAAAGSRPVLVGNIVTPIDFAPREVELLSVLRPKLSRLAVLVNPANSSHRGFFEAIGAAAKRKGWDTLGAEVEHAIDLPATFDELRANSIAAVVIAEDGLFGQDALQIAALARERRMASVGQRPSYADAGCLLSCGEDTEPRFRALAMEIDRILKGGQPQEQATFRPARIPVVINRSTAKAIGVTVPASLQKSASFVEGG